MANDLGITLSGQANAIVDTMNHSPWVQLHTDADQAIKYANLGYLVVAGLKAAPNGHVAVIVPSPSRPYPTGYWGRLGGIGQKNMAINWAWKHADLAHVQYYAGHP